MESAAAYGALVERLERQSREAPGLYKFKLGLLACFGFAVLGGSALVALGLSAGLVIGLALVSPILLIKLVKFIWIPIAFGWFLLKALWVRFDPPEGYRLAPGEAPELVAEVERLRRETGAPRLEAILIDSALNAAAASVPRASGLFGHRHYLVIGLPLMQLLGRDQLLAVIAHEFGHFGGGHSRFSGWIYRVRVSWFRVLAAMEESGSRLSKAYIRFFHWYAPYFNAYSFSLSRANEYEADAAAARIAGPEVAAQALVRMHLGSDRLEREFWPALRAVNRERPAPPTHLFSDMGVHLRQPAEHDAARFSDALAAVPSLEDTHPTLAQRLAALGFTGDPSTEPQASAAEVLLGPLTAELEVRFSDEWRTHVAHTWEANHREHAEGTARLAELEAMSGRDAAQTCEYASLVEDLRPEEDPVPLYTLAVEAAPNDAYSHYRLGVLLLPDRPEEGIRHVRKAMELAHEAIEPGATLLACHYAAIGDEDARRAAEAELDALYQQRQRSALERGRVTTSDVYLPHGLSGEHVEEFRSQMKALGAVKKAWVVRKDTGDQADAPHHFVVLIAWRGLIFSEQANLQRVVDALELPGSFIVITAPNQRRIAGRVRKASGAPTFGA